MVNTKQTFHSEKKAISPTQSTDRGGRAPFFFNLRVVSEQARERASSERASWGEREGGPEGHELDKSLRAVREQKRIDVAPVIDGQRWDLAVVIQQPEDRRASIKFYGHRPGLL